MPFLDLDIPIGLRVDQRPAARFAERQCIEQHCDGGAPDRDDEWQGGV